MRMLAFSQPSRDQHRDPPVVTNLHPCSMPERPQALPVRCPHGRVRRPAGRHDRTGFRTPHARSYPAGHTVPSTWHPWRTGSDADRERTNGIRTSSIATTTKTARRAHTEPRLWRSVCGLATRLLGATATLRATVTTAATRQLRDVALPSERRLGALLSSDEFRVERRASGEASSVMAGLECRSGVRRSTAVDDRGVASGCMWGCRLWVDVAGAGWR
jgi:hypothetical protein